MATLTRSLTINAAFLQELKDFNIEYRAGLEQLAQLGSSPSLTREQLATVPQTLKRLRDVAATQYSLEETYGYINGGLNVTPQTAERTRTALDQHAGIYQAFQHLISTVEDWYFQNLLESNWSSAADQIRALSERLDAHEQLEKELMRRA